MIVKNLIAKQIPLLYYKSVMVERKPEEDNWQKPFKKAFESIDFDILPKGAYEWCFHNAKLQKKLNRFTGKGKNSDIAEDILLMRIPKEDREPVFRMLDEAMNRIYARPDSLKACSDLPIGKFYVIPIAALWDEDRLVWFRMRNVSREQYKEYLVETIHEANSILAPAQKPLIPDYPL